ncbi:hypothetical protein [Serratia marcescens]|uniref:hypothetical protein n=1 Tax=Serratia marcescens TaxID=615 RepID=UPI0036D3E24F
MMNRGKLEHILAYARQQKQFGSPTCRIPSGDMVEIMERLLAQPVSSGYKLPDGCKWNYDDIDSKWDSACGDAWMFSDGGPTENGVKFCQGCGKPVLLAAAPEGGNG